MTIKMLHVGRKVPKDLAARGWRERPGSIHIGRGVWILVLEKDVVSGDEEAA